MRSQEIQEVYNFIRSMEFVISTKFITVMFFHTNVVNGVILYFTIRHESDQTHIDHKPIPALCTFEFSVNHMHLKHCQQKLTERRVK